MGRLNDAGPENGGLKDVTMENGGPKIHVWNWKMQVYKYGYLKN